MKSSPKPARRSYVSRHPKVNPPAAQTAPEPEPSPKPQPKRRLSQAHLAFVAQLATQNFQDPETAAKLVGFSRPGMGHRLAHRLSDLIESERLRVSMAQQMELDEALKLLAMVARSREDLKTQHAALRTVLQVHGVLSDKPMPPSDRRGLANQVEALIGKIREKMGNVPAGGRMRIRAAFEAESTPSEAPENPSPEPYKELYKK